MIFVFTSQLITANPNHLWAYIWEGLLSKGHLCLRFWGGLFSGGLIFGGAGYRNFTVFYSGISWVFLNCSVDKQLGMTVYIQDLFFCNTLCFFMPLVNLMAPKEDQNVEREILSSSASQSQQTEEETLDDDSPCSPENSLASDGNSSDLRNVDHASIEQAVHRVVQEVIL